MWFPNQVEEWGCVWYTISEQFQLINVVTLEKRQMNLFDLTFDYSSLYLNLNFFQTILTLSGSQKAIPEDKRTKSIFPLIQICLVLHVNHCNRELILFSINVALHKNA